VCRRDDTDRHANADGDGHRRGGQFQRGRHALRDEIDGRLLLAKRDAEVAVDGFGQKIEILHEPRAIEAHLMSEGLDLLLVPGLAGHEHGRIAAEKQRAEREDGDAQQHKDRLGQPAGEVGDHTSPDDARPLAEAASANPPTV
jgi:hypothetical protein